MSDDHPDYYHKAKLPTPDRFPPRTHRPGPPPGETFTELVEKHGKPIGVFDIGRQLIYRGGK